MSCVNEEQHTIIKAALHERGMSLGSVARAERVATTTLSLVSRGYRRSRRLEHAIAQALDADPAHLWPERYKK
jgi:lambda repressor-like predicted transcriptional regulator